MIVQSKIVRVMVELKAHFMAATNSQARQAHMCQALEVLESYLTSHEISQAFFLAALEEIEEWDWKYQLKEIRSLPERRC